MTTILFIDSPDGEIEAVEQQLDNRDDIRAGIGDAIRIAAEMADELHARVDRTMEPWRAKTKRERWRNDDLLTKYFGGKITVAQIRAVRRRINRAHRRLTSDKLRIRLLPQDRASSDTTNGHNSGGPFSPRTFVLYPAWFGWSRQERAAIVLHELLHDWHIDHKLNGEVVRGEAQADALARQDRGKARRNPENYEHAGLELHRRNHGTLNELQSFRGGPKPPTRAAGAGPRRTRPDAPRRTRPTAPRRTRSTAAVSADPDHGAHRALPWGVHTLVAWTRSAQDALRMVK